jgi:hypothetical protein
MATYKVQVSMVVEAKDADDACEKANEFLLYAKDAPFDDSEGEGFTVEVAVEVAA